MLFRCEKVLKSTTETNRIKRIIKAKTKIVTLGKFRSDLNRTELSPDEQVLVRVS